MGTTSREAASAAYEALEAAAGGGGEAPSADSGDVGSSPADGPPADADAVSTSGEAGGAGGPPGGEAGPKSEGRARDATGKFAKAETTTTDTPRKPAEPAKTKTPAPANGTATPPAAPAVTTPTPAPKYKAPQAWKPAIREKWGALPEDVQAEVERWNKEVNKTMQEAAEPKKFHDQFRQTVAPYEGMLKAEGIEPMQAVGSLLQTMAALRTAPAPHKAQMIANMVRTFGVPIDALDAALSGAQMPQGQGQPQAFDQEAFAQQMEQRFVQRMQAERQQATNAKVKQEIEAFAPNAEFFDDVREGVADLMERASKRGRTLSLEQAYSRALELEKADPESEIGGVLRQRDAAEAAKAQVASTQRARAASTSLKSTAAPSTGAKPKTSREAAEAAWEQLAGR